MLLKLYRKYFTHLLLFLPMVVDKLECEGSRRRTFFNSLDWSASWREWRLLVLHTHHPPLQQSTTYPCIRYLDTPFNTAMFTYTTYLPYLLYKHVFFHYAWSFCCCRIMFYPCFILFNYALLLLLHWITWLESCQAHIIRIHWHSKFNKWQTISKLPDNLTTNMTTAHNIGWWLSAREGQKGQGRTL